MKTKERIAIEALTLFSKKGYHGVSVKEIAEAVGIKDSSLYKHYKSKREIFETILSMMSERMEQLGNELNLPNGDDEFDHSFENMKVDELITVSQKAFLFYAKDDFAVKFRHMLTIEQYGDDEVSKLYQKIFFDEGIRYQTKVFTRLIQKGYLQELDPEILAINYYAPLFYLICRYDCESELEEALDRVKIHVTEFYRIYAKTFEI